MPIKTFSIASQRSKHFLLLYKILKNNRARSVRADWATKFKTLMRWPARENFVRIDGHEGNSMLILRDSVGVTPEYFNHDLLSELLRASVVSSVSALDRYMHDLIMGKIWGLMGKSESELTSSLKKVSIPAYEVKKAIAQIRKDENSRPGGKIKKVIQDVLHKEYTFQSAEKIFEGSRILGIDDFWTEVAKKMPGNPPKKEVIDHLRSITKRRNQIVHEADLPRSIRSRGTKFREIKFKYAEETVEWMAQFVKAIDEVASN